MHHLFLKRLNLNLPIPIALVQSCSRTRAARVRRCRRPPHLCRTCSAVVPPGSCRHQLIRLHHQLLRTSSLGLASCTAACSCKRSCCSTCAGCCPTPTVCPRCGNTLLLLCLPNGGIAGIGGSGDHCHLHHHLLVRRLGNWAKTRKNSTFNTWREHLWSGGRTRNCWIVLILEPSPQYVCIWSMR